MADIPADLPKRLGSVIPFSVRCRRWSEGVFPPAALTSARVLCDVEEAFSAMESAIAEAKAEVRVAFYIWRCDETGRRVANLLADKARAGVRVTILVDAVGDHAFLRKLGKPLRWAGARVAGFLPARFRPWAPTFNFRNHRKLVLVDGDVGFVGGMNIGDEYARSWHDLAFELRGATVANLDDVFQEDWFFAAKSESEDSRTPNPIPQPRGGEDLCAVVASGPIAMKIGCTTDSS